MKDTQHKPRVLVIGLDGATWDIMTPWINQGLLPNLAKFQQTGASGHLASTIHPLTTPAWVSFLTGRTQGQHGVYDHVQRQKGSYGIQILDSTRIKSQLIFDYLGQAGMRSISVNIPLTFPPPSINGLMVSGLFGTITGPGITAPPTLFERIHRIAPGYVVHPDYKPLSSTPLETYVADLKQSVKDRFKVAETLFSEEEWQFAAVVFTATDQIQHAFWAMMEDEPTPATRPFQSAIYDIYKLIDDNLPRLLRLADENTLVVIMSDHGAGRLKSWVNLNRWLADEGYLTFKQSKQGKRQSRLISRIAAAYKKYMPQPLRAWVRRTWQKQFTTAKERMESELFASAINWSQTRVYALGACGNIFINTVGREPEGIVQPGQAYEVLREQLIERLGDLRIPGTDEPLVQKVWRREELYHGPYLEDAPDLVITWTDYGYWGRARYDQNWPEIFEPVSTWDFSSLPLSGTHRPNGIFMAQGPGVVVNPTVAGAALIDLMPTFLAFLGVPVPRTLDGRVLEEIFADGLPGIMFVDDDEHTDDTGFAFTPEEEAKVMQHLENLGYL